MNTRHERVYGEEVIKTRLLGELQHWRYAGGLLCRTWRTKDWRATMLAAGAVAHLAEAAWHHPEMVLNFASLEVRLNTHSAGGITDKDFELASRIEAVVGWRPDGEGALDGLPTDADYVLADR